MVPDKTMFLFNTGLHIQIVPHYGGGLKKKYLEGQGRMEINIKELVYYFGFTGASRIFHQ